MTGAGAMRTRLILEQAVDMADGAGGSLQVWQAIAELWAEVIPLSGGERYAFDQTDALMSFRVRTRFRRDVRPEMRLRWDDRLLDIQAAFDPDGRRQKLECLCQERLH